MNSPEPDNLGRIELADMIGHLRAELQKAQQFGKDQPLRLLVDAAEIEVQAVVTREATAGGGIKFWVCAEVGGKVANAATQKIVLRLRPVRSNGSVAEVAAYE